MSDAQLSKDITAAQADARAAFWLERRDRRDWSDADQAALDAWLAESIAHRVAYWRLNAAWGRTERLSVLRSAQPPERAGRSRLRTIFARGAAGVCVAAAVGAATYLYPHTDEWTYATPLGGHETVRLSDGSQIELNTDTVIRVASDKSQRKVWLDKGEAYFQIRHDAEHPFTVIARGHRIVDLGTKFVVREDGSSLKVALVEGSARFEAASGAAQGRPTILSPGDILVAIGDNVSLSKKPIATLNTTLSWRRDVLVFNHTSLGAAAEEFNRYNGEKLVIADGSAAARTIGGTFPKNGLADFAEVARGMLGLKVRKSGNEIVISR